MSGLQEVAGVFGIAELALRSISQIYEFVRYLKDAPQTVSRLFTELEELLQCLSGLKSIDFANSSNETVVEELSLAATVNRCGKICSELEVDLRKWTRGRQETLLSRVRIRLNKNKIDDAIGDVSFAKQTINLAVSICTLRSQKDLSRSMSQAQALQMRPKDERLAEDIDMPDALEEDRASAESKSMIPSKPAGNMAASAKDKERPQNDNTRPENQSSQGASSNSTFFLSTNEPMVKGNKVRDSYNTHVASNYSPSSSVMDNEVDKSVHTYIGSSKGKGGHQSELPAGWPPPWAPNHPVNGSSQ